MGVELRVQSLRPHRLRNQDLVRLHADSVLIRGFPPALQRKSPEDQFLSFPGRATESEGARLAADPAKHVPRAGGLRNAQTRELMPESCWFRPESLPLPCRATLPQFDFPP